ncbi:hypothetical protein ACH492_00150 [Streptomyces sp. NPDC019443]|uniref:hypothetical protein n=1 Tax=Streptomyces sp. NPDC019443 TaxID=3365061 RepID=UPI0037BC4CEF
MAGCPAARVHIDPANDGSETVSAVADHVRAEFLTRIGLHDLLTPTARSIATAPSIASLS